MADKLKNYILLRNGKVIYTKYKTYDYKAVWHVKGPNTNSESEKGRYVEN